MHPLTIRLPDDVYEHYRTQAFHERNTINALITAILDNARGHLPGQGN